MTSFETRNNQRTYDTDTHKVVPDGAIVLTLDDPAEFVRILRGVGLPGEPSEGDCKHIINGSHSARRLGVIADQIEAQTQPPKPPFELGQRVRYIGTDNHVEAWVLRRDEHHVGIVVQILDNGCVRVWDTVEQSWWLADSPQLEAVPS